MLNAKWRLVSKGQTAGDLLIALKKQGKIVTPLAEALVLKGMPQPTSGVVYRAGVLYGREFEDKERTANNIVNTALARGLRSPTLEAGLLLALEFYRSETALTSLIIFHPGVYIRKKLGQKNRYRCLFIDPGKIDTIRRESFQPYFEDRSFVFLLQ